MSAPSTTRGGRKRFLLRLPPDLYEVLERWAADELRSVNGQIEFLLAEAVRRAGREVGRRGPSGRSLPRR